MDVGELERRADVVSFAAGRRVVVAGPGSGKTRLLVDRLVHLLAVGAPPATVLTLVFNRRAAAELRRRLAAAQIDRGLVELRIATFHSFGLSLADRFWRRTSLAGRPALLPTAEQRAVVRSLLARAPDPDGWTVPDAVRRSESFGRHVADALLRVQESMRTPADDPALAACLRRYLDVLAGRARLDHAGVLATAATLLDDPEVRDALGVEHLLVDEYQDVNAAQERVVARLASTARSVVVVGDPDQAIYGFRGASRAALERAARTLDADEIRLTRGFRCPQPIVDAASSLTGAPPLIGVDGPGGVGAAAFAHRNDELEWIADHVRRLGLTTSWSDIAVLSRSLRTLRGPITAALLRAGVPFRVGGGARSAASHPWVARLLDLLQLAAGEGGVDAAAVLEAAAVGPLVGAEALGLREAFRAGRRAGGAEAGLQAWAEVHGAGEVLALLDAVAAARRSARDGHDVATTAWALWSRLPARRRLEAVDLAAPTPADVEGGRAVGAWHEALTRFVERNPSAATVGSYLDTVAEDEADDPWLSDAEDAAPAVAVLTVHQAKGLEFDHVVVPALEEGRFPVVAQCSGLGSVTAEDAAAEERRLLYVALTRARRSVTLTATVGTEDRAEASPSRFFTDLGPFLVDPQTLHPSPAPGATFLEDVVTVAEARRTWGRVLRDADAPDHDRLGAAAGLRALAGNDGPLRLPWVAEPTLEPAGPLRSTPWRLSASAIATYLGCGRQFLYDRVLRLAPWQEHAHGAFGTAVHAAIRGWLEAGEDPERSLLEDRLAEAFERLAQPAMALGVQRESFRRRLPTIARHVAEELLPALGRLVRVEGDLAVDGPHGVRLIARPDLVTEDGEGDGVEVVDWKTGSAKRRDASGDVQLAVYHHVVGEALQQPVRRLRLAYVWAGTWAEQPVPLGHDATCADLVEAAAGGITAEHFEVGAEPPCRHCAVQVLCDRQPRGQDLPW